MAPASLHVVAGSRQRGLPLRELDVYLRATMRRTFARGAGGVSWTRSLARLAVSGAAASLLTLRPVALARAGVEVEPPLELAADHLELDLDAKTGLLSGHVKLTRGALALACPRVELRYDQVPHVVWARGSGGVTAEMKGLKAEAPEVEIDLAARSLELRGGVRVTQGEGWITAERATLQLATGKLTMSDVKGALPLPKPPP